MKDSTEHLGGTVSGRSRRRSADVDALMPESPPLGATYLTLFMSLFSVGTGIALLTAGNTPTGAPIPVVSLVFLVAGLLLWSVASIERETGNRKTGP